MANANGKDERRPAPLDMNALWARAAGLMRENRQLLWVIAGVFILLPNAMIYLFLPPSGAMQEPINVLMDPASSEAAIERARLAVAEAMQPVLGWVALLSLVQHIGYGAMLALLGPARPTVGQAIVTGLTVMPSLIAALLAFGFGWVLALFLVQLALIPLGVTTAAFLGSVIGLMLGLFLAARLSLTLPVMAIERVYNPFAALLRSWRLTGASKRAVLLFWMLLIIAYTVVFILFSGIGGVIAAIPASPGASALTLGVVMGVLGVGSGIVICASAAAMLGQLSPPGSGGGTGARTGA